MSSRYEQLLKSNLHKKSDGSPSPSSASSRKSFNETAEGDEPQTPKVKTLRGSSRTNSYDSAASGLHADAGGELFDNGGEEQGNIRVVCRFRPQNSIENEKQGKLSVKFGDDRKTVSLLDVVHGEERQKFSFDRVFNTESKQSDVYSFVGYPVVKSVLEGYNGTVFAYGQTGSGKTHTMEGELNDDAMRGIIPRMITTLFDGISSADENLEFTIKVSMIEIYLEKIRCLIDPSRTNLQIRQEANKGIWVEDATEVYMSEATQIFDIMNIGHSNRATASTNMNEGSSRSHSIFMVTVQQQHVQTLSTKVGKLFLVDLAGSEKIRKTGATGARLEEAKNINKSLSTLGNVINALTDGTSLHVPYRDSKLTRVLQESLGGNSKTALVICCSPSSFNANETLSTLRFGSRAKLIQNKARVNEELSPLELRELLRKANEEIQILRSGGVVPGEVELVESHQVESLQSQVQDFKDEVTDLNEVNDHLTDQINIMRTDLAAKDAEILRLSTKQASDSSHLESLTEQVEELRSARQEAEAAAARQADLGRKLEQWKQKAQEAVELCRRTQEDAAVNSEKALATIDKKRNKYAAKLAAAEDRYERSRSQLNEVQSQLGTLESQIQRRDEELLEAKVRQESLVASFEEEKASIASQLEQQRQQAVGELDAVQARLVSSQAEVARVVQEKAVLVDAHATAVNELKNQHLSHDNELELKIKQLTEELLVAKQLLEDTKAAHDETVDALKAELASSEKEHALQLEQMVPKQELLKLTAEHQAAVAALQGNHEELFLKHVEETQQLKRQVGKVQQALEAESQLKGKLQAQLDALQASFDAKAAECDDRGRQLAQQTEAHQTAVHELQALCSQAQKELDLRREQNSAAEAAHEEARGALNSSLAALQEQLASSVPAAELARVRAQLDTSDAELKQSVASKEQQLADERETRRNELQALENSHALRLSEVKSGHLKEVTKLRDELTERNKAAVEQLQQSQQQELAALQDTLTRSETEWEQRREQLEDRNRQLADQLETSNEDAARASDQATELQLKSERLEEQVKSLTAKLLNSEGSVKLLNENALELEDKVAKMTNNYQSDLEISRNEYNKLKTELAEVVAKCNELVMQNDTLVADKRNFESVKTTEFTARLNQLQVELDGALADSKEATATAASVAADKQRLEENLNKLNVALTSKDQQLVEMRETVDKQGNSNNALKLVIKQNEALIADNEKLINSLKLSINKESNRLLEEIQTSKTNLIKLQDDYNKLAMQRDTLVSSADSSRARFDSEKQQLSAQLAAQVEANETASKKLKHAETVVQEKERQCTTLQTELTQLRGELQQASVKTSSDGEALNVQLCKNKELSSKLGSLQQELEATNKAVNELKTQNNQLTYDKDISTNECNKLREINNQLIVDMNANQNVVKEHAELRQQLSRYENQILSHDHNTSALKAQVTALNKKVVDLSHAVKATESQSSRDADAKTVQLNALNAKLAELAKELQDKKLEYQSAVESNDQLQLELKKVVEQNAALCNEMSSLKGSELELQSKQHGLQNAHDELLATYNRAAGELAALRERYQSLTTKHNQEITVQSDKLAKFQTELRELMLLYKSEKKQYKTEVADWRAKFEQLSTQHAALTASSQQASSRVEACNKVIGEKEAMVEALHRQLSVCKAELLSSQDMVASFTDEFQTFKTQKQQEVDQYKANSELASQTQASQQEAKTKQIEAKLQQYVTKYTQLQDEHQALAADKYSEVSALKQQFAADKLSWEARVTKQRLDHQTAVEQLEARLRAEAEHSQSLLAGNKESVASLNATNTKLQSELASQQEVNSNLQGANQQLSKQVSLLQQQVTDLKSIQLEGEESHNRQLSQVKQKSAVDLEAAINEALTREKEIHEAETFEVTSEVELLRKQIVGLKLELDASKAELEVYTLKEPSSRLSSKSDTGDSGELRYKAQTTATRLKHFEASLAAKCEEASELETKLAAATDQINEFAIESNSLKHKVQIAESSVKEITELYNKALKENTNLNVDYQVQKKQLARTEARLEVLNKQVLDERTKNAALHFRSNYKLRGGGAGAGNATGAANSKVVRSSVLPADKAELSERVKRLLQKASSTNSSIKSADEAKQ